MEIKKHDFVLICEYGSDRFWSQVEEIKGDIIVCDNGHGKLFEVNRSDIYEVSQDDAVFK